MLRKILLVGVLSFGMCSAGPGAETTTHDPMRAPKEYAAHFRTLLDRMTPEQKEEFVKRFALLKEKQSDVGLLGLGALWIALEVSTGNAN